MPVGNYVAVRAGQVAEDHRADPCLAAADRLERDLVRLARTVDYDLVHTGALARITYKDACRVASGKGDYIKFVKEARIVQCNVALVVQCYPSGPRFYYQGGGAHNNPAVRIADYQDVAAVAARDLCYLEYIVEVLYDCSACKAVRTVHELGIRVVFLECLAQLQL